MKRTVNHTSGPIARQRRNGRGLWAIAALLAAGISSAEYLLNAWLNPTVDWNLSGIAAHWCLDFALITPLIALAMWAGSRLAAKLGCRAQDWEGLLGRCGAIALVFVLVMLPYTASRDFVHEWAGNGLGIALAEVQTTVVSSDLTVQEATQLCSFGSVRSGDVTLTLATSLQRLATHAISDTLVQLAVFLPLLLLCLYRAQRGALPRPDTAPARALWDSVRRPLRYATVAGAALAALVIAGERNSQSALSVAQAQVAGTPYNACTDGGPVKEYDVSAIDVTMPLNRWGDHVVDAHTYALNANIPGIRAFETALEADRLLPESNEVARVSYGLRKDPIQPLVIRANLGDCLVVNFTNLLNDSDPASMHILGLAHTVDSAGSAVGYNPDTMAGPQESITYRIPLPLDPEAERAYYFHDHGAGRRRQNMGLFGAIVAEPQGSVYLDTETGEPLDTITGSNWEAIIMDPGTSGRSDAKSFREFVILYHEIGDEAFTDIRDREGKMLPLIDELAGIYRPGARAINYRSEPFRNRIAQDKASNGELAGHGKSLGYSSYPFGDPATPIPRSYVGEGVKTRLMHGGSEIFHVHHLHGGGDRWRRSPNADPNNDFWKGLTKVPDPNLTSIHLDSQSIGPGTSYNLEHECGAGGCQQAVGDFLYHCHIGHHYLSGMWAFWRVFGTEQTVDSNLHGYPLAVASGLFQADNPFSDDEAGSNTPPQPGVSAGALLGTVVDDGRVLVPDGQVADPETEFGVLRWIIQMLPPRGVPLDNSDATVWDWTFTGAGQNLKIWGPAENIVPFPGYVSDNPGQRPEVRFNPKNARYTWPLFRPQLAQRPPFSARHSGAPWLGEEMKDGRVDGLCARNGVHPGVDVGNAVDRYYPVSSITLPVQVSSDTPDPDGMIFVLNEDEQAIRDGTKPAEPLSIRSNVGDCVEIVFTNKIPDAPLNKEYSKTNIHSHFVQFDPQASDGVITGFAYEQSVRPYANEERVLTQAVQPGTTTLSVSNTDRLRPGIWIGVGLGEGVCGTNNQGQAVPCTEVRKIRALPDAQTIVLDRPLRRRHRPNEAVGVEFVRYKWYSDVDFGTVFFHTHVDFKDWDHGLFGTHIVEPKGSTYHDPVTGAEVRSGTVVDIRVDPSAGGNPVAAGVNGSFREFMLFLQNNNPVEGPFSAGGGTINLRAEPWRLRDAPGDDPAYRFSSVTHGDPHTPTVRAYVGDPVVVRGMGLVERVGGVRVTGHRFNSERYTANSDIRDAMFIGISERFDVALQGGAGGTGGYPGDYLYYSTLGKDFESGAWGLLRVMDGADPTLQPLPGVGAPAGAGSFPALGVTGDVPPSLGDGPGDACPEGVTVREYSLAITNANIVYNELTVPDTTGVAFQPQSSVTSDVRTPAVMRVNAGECLRVNLRNDRSKRASLSVGELVADPQRSYGAAIGLNHDSTVAPGDTRTYEYYADAELGVVVALNLADIDSAPRGGFAGVVVEPEGSSYLRPGLEEPLPDGGMGVQADIVSAEGVRTREFVVLFSDEDERLGHNTMPYNVDVERFAGINYSHEPLSLRDKINRPGDVFKSDIWGDPRHVVTVPAGSPLVYRVSHAWGNQMHLPTLEGHRFPQEPGMGGSEQIFNDVLAPGMSYNLHFVGGAGGDIAAPGDYLFLDRRQPFMEWGLWSILSVTADEAVVGTDEIEVYDVARSNAEGRTRIALQGRNGIRPAGDTARHVRVHAGGLNAAGRCSGEILGRARVDRGNGAWEIELDLAKVPEEICIRSSGGGSLALKP